MVEKWLDADWPKMHQEKKDHRMLMPGAPHHQGMSYPVIIILGAHLGSGGIWSIALKLS
jgi:hypothetical protein